jgi:antitoxin MazE
MKTRVRKWGNSLALRIPGAYAAEARLVQDSIVELSVEDGLLTVRPARLSHDLHELLEAVTEQNLHHEVEYGPRIGDEAW